MSRRDQIREWLIEVGTGCGAFSISRFEGLGGGPGYFVGGLADECIEVTREDYTAIVLTRILGLLAVEAERVRPASPPVRVPREHGWRAPCDHGVYSCDVCGP